MTKKNAGSVGVRTLLLAAISWCGVSVFFSQSAIGQGISAPMTYGWDQVGRATSSKPPRWSEIQSLPRVHIHSAASAALAESDQLSELAAWNRGGNLPVKIGFTRSLAAPINIEFEGLESLLGDLSAGPLPHQNGYLLQLTQDQYVWTTSVHVDDAHRLRIKLTDVQLGPDAKLWVHNDSGEYVGPFGQELMDDAGDIWTPSVSGPSLSLTLLFSAQSLPARLVIEDILELFDLDLAGTPILGRDSVEGLGCLQEAQCFSSSTFTQIGSARRAVAMIHFVLNGSGARCSGGLLSDLDDSTTIPHFLTANHCIASSSSASSVEAFWDYHPSSCGGSAPPLGSVPRTNGASLLATGSAIDFTLLRLNSVPSGRAYFGWTTQSSAISQGTTLHMISHPNGNVQQYTQSNVAGGSYACTNVPRSSFIYTDVTIGASTGGSSGGLVSLDNGQVVGIFKGHCPFSQFNECDYGSYYELNGKFSVFYSALESYLGNSSASPPDLALTHVDVENGTYDQGDEITVANITENVGGTDSGSYRIVFYLSTNTTISDSDYRIGNTPERPPLEAGQTHNYTTRPDIPSTIPDGNYYVGAIIDYSDSNQGNNSNYDATRITIGGSSMPFTAGFNGNWWGGQSVSGEGAQVEISSNGNGGLTFVATFYTYDRDGNQVFLIAVGSVNGGTAEVDVYITSGGGFGSGLGGSGQERTWGSGTFTAVHCGAIDMTLRPNSQFRSLGFRNLSYRLERLTSSVLPCP